MKIVNKESLISLLLVLVMSIGLTGFTNIAYAQEKYFFTLHFVSDTLYTEEHEYYISEWRKIGIDFKVDTLAWDAMLNVIMNNKKAGMDGWDLATGSLDYVYSTPDTRYFYSSRNIPPNGANDGGWTNGLSDYLLDEGAKTFDYEERKEIYMKWQEVFSDDVPWLMSMQRGAKDLFADEVVNAQNFSKAYFNTGDEYISIILAGLHRQGSDTFRFASSWWPFAGIPGYAVNCFASLVLRSLVTHDPKTGEIIGDLADSWEVDTDAKTFTFHLKKDVVWSDGVPLNATDVKFTFDIFRNSVLGHMDSTYLNNMIDHVETPDDNTVVFHMKLMEVTFMDYLSRFPYPSMAIIPYHALKDIPLTADAWMKSDAMANGKIPSTGPLIVTDVVPEDRVEWKRNTMYNGPYPAQFEKLIFKLIVAPATAYAAVESDEVDMLDQWYEPAAEWAAFQENPQLQPVLTPTTFNVGVQMNLNSPYLNNKYVRKALAYALPNERYATQIGNGTLWANDLPIPKEHPFFNNDSSLQYPYNLEKAKEMMEKAGYLYSNLENPQVGVPLIYAASAIVIVFAAGVTGTYAVMRRHSRRMRARDISKAPMG
jgi:ABC-type transport system substrate-binding protein